MTIHTLDLHFLDVSDSIAAFAIERPDDSIVLIECGPYSTWPALCNALKTKGLDVKNVQHVLLSHIHFDHAGAAWALAEQGATVYVHPVGLPHLAAPEKLYNSARQIYGEHMDELWGRMEPIAAERLYAPQHGEVFDFLGLKCTAWHTPGHATHHIAWQVESEGHSVLFAGDVAGVRIGSGSPVMPPCPPPDIDVEAWQGSIALMQKLPVSSVFLTHFGEITDLAAHFEALETRLLAWAAWMRPHFEAQTPAADIIPQFSAYVRDSLLREGVSAEGLARYDAANPAFMSVAGLLRYWKKRATSGA
jgi:glyoxylase-like metal-dependent hydrolase (beta-lactamase superfamily II)